jgi:hypothetical protein
MRGGSHRGFRFRESRDRVLGFFPEPKVLVNVDGKHIERNARRSQQVRAPRRTGGEHQSHGNECYDDFVDSLHTVVPRALTELFRHGPMSQGKLEVAWRVAVGDALTRVTTVRLQPDGVVEVQPVDQRWHKELKRSSSMILTRLIGLLGTESVTRIVVK